MKNDELIQLTKYTKKLSLLYVEDDQSIADITMRILAYFFDTIIYAYDGKDGILKFNENHIDIIITDINMPNLNGLEMLAKIKELNPTTPSIVMTAHNETEYYQNAIGLNVKGYILKPASIKEITAILIKIVDKKKQEDIRNDKFNYLLTSNKKLIDIGYQISSQKDFNRLLETILLGAKELSGADGGTLYLFNENDKTLEFKIVNNSSLNIHHGGTKNHISWPALKIYNENDTINNKNVSIVCATQDKLININDIYHSTTFDFSGAKNFDTNNNYKTTSMLVIPMKNRDNELIGVIQLINKINDNTIVSFNKDDEALITSMSSQAAMMIQNNQLVKDLEVLLYSLIKSIGTALNEKSNYTARHIDNVAKLSKIIIDGINNNNDTYKDISFTAEEEEEIKLSAWLHDIGKIATPEHIIDKSTKLETIYDKINIIEAKFEILKRDIEIAFLKGDITQDIKDTKIKQIEKDIIFLNSMNSGELFMNDEFIDKLNSIAKQDDITINNKKTEVIDKNNLYNLSIKKGTLSAEDREVINNHVVVTYNMLKEVPFPKRFANVSKIAGSHHKTVDGKGYASKEILNQELTLADRILVIADIFEALSAQDRPYKDPNKLSQIANIFLDMVKNRELDKDLVKVFFQDKLYLEYAQENLSEAQRDTIDIDFEEFEYN